MELSRMQLRAGDVIEAAGWNEKVRWTLADLLPEEALPPDQTGTFDIVVRYWESPDPSIES